jgi:hypothetical protein
VVSTQLEIESLWWHKGKEKNLEIFYSEKEFEEILEYFENLMRESVKVKMLFFK